LSCAAPLDACISGDAASQQTQPGRLKFRRHLRRRRHSQASATSRSRDGTAAPLRRFPM